MDLAKELGGSSVRSTGSEEAGRYRLRFSIAVCNVTKIAIIMKTTIKHEIVNSIDKYAAFLHLTRT